MWDSCSHGPQLSAVALNASFQAGMAGRRLFLLLLVVAVEMLTGGCVPGDGSAKQKGGWRWKGDRSRE